MFFKKCNKVSVLIHNVKTTGISNIQAAHLVHVQGQGTLAARSFCPTACDGDSRVLSQITLNNIPLAQLNSPLTPTGSGLLATGYGLANANCQEIMEIQKRMNEPFVSLEESIEVLTPLLTLLHSGLYIIADVLCYPTDGNGNFFWNVPNELQVSPAAMETYYSENMRECVCMSPVFLYPTQDTDCYNEDRVNHYKDVLKSNVARPRAVVLGFNQAIGFLLDGHHKATASFLLKKPLECIAIIPPSGYRLKTKLRTARPSSVYFSQVKIPVTDIPRKFRNSVFKQFQNSTRFEISSGTINHRNWEDCYRVRGKFPCIVEYAEGVAAGISPHVPVSDEQIEACFADPTEEGEARMAALLSVLHGQDDPRVIPVAIKCAKITSSFPLQHKAYEILSEKKGDPDVERLFIEYLVKCSDATDPVFQLMQTYWD
ncbi:MAG: hypothetical protein Q4G68_08175 [Planctomycetia bacterium]|nr:hypothetical protein [Planctomycetia bacterium]